MQSRPACWQVRPSEYKRPVAAPTSELPDRQKAIRCLQHVFQAMPNMDIGGQLPLPHPNCLTGKKQFGARSTFFRRCPIWTSAAGGRPPPSKRLGACTILYSYRKLPDEKSGSLLHIIGNRASHAQYHRKSKQLMILCGKLGIARECKVR